MKRLDFFLSHVGKRIFRTKNGCDCEICEEVYQNGLLILDTIHAEYLHDIEAEFQIEGTDLKYFSTIEERNDYEIHSPLSA